MKNMNWPIWKRQLTNWPSSTAITWKASHTCFTFKSFVAEMTVILLVILKIQIEVQLSEGWPKHKWYIVTSTYPSWVAISSFEYRSSSSNRMTRTEWGLSACLLARRINSVVLPANMGPIQVSSEIKRLNFTNNELDSTASLNWSELCHGTWLWNMVRGGHSRKDSRIKSSSEKHSFVNLQQGVINWWV